MTRTRPWEHGSFFDLTLEHGVARYPWAGREHSLWGSGRDAVRALVDWGRTNLAWGRVLVPSYYCQTVPAALAHAIDLAVYPFDPTDGTTQQIVTREGDAVLVPAMFGAAPAVRVDSGVPVIEDHTHDPVSPLAFESTGTYAFASLRKTLPLPDGGVLWSPANHSLPPEIEPTVRHDRDVLMRLTAMALKRDYLSGAGVPKAVFRDLYVASEDAIGTGTASGMSAYSRARLATLPTDRWRQVRARNLATFTAALGEPAGAHVLDFPYAAIILFDDWSVSGTVRRTLAAASIYVAILWPLEDAVLPGVPADHVGLARRMLMINCDHRYSTADMERVARAVRDAAMAATASGPTRCQEATASTDRGLEMP